jgi:hypothetical protein
MRCARQQNVLRELERIESWLSYGKESAQGRRLFRMRRNRRSGTIAVSAMKRTAEVAGQLPADTVEESREEQNRRSASKEQNCRNQLSHHTLTAAKG